MGLHPYLSRGTLLCHPGDPIPSAHRLGIPLLSLLDLSCYFSVCLNVVRMSAHMNVYVNECRRPQRLDEVTGSLELESQQSLNHVV